ncbi:tripartite tricarboxylate transporter substrate binding protein [Microbaculum marinum]|uniref:Tripartite tricarboxylate transporter substrate binding protein n=1 Tax=Microbaculum marinum TaxID=1764581 RepID=A0AAW9RT92_9HYPH
MKKWTAAMAAVGALFASTALHAQDYPGKPITVIVPYGAGQATDVMCRVFLEQLKVELGATIVIENRVGAASNVGASEASKARPDGYTLLCTGSATHVANPLIYSDMGFDPDTSLLPITGIASTGYVVATGSAFKGKTIGDVIEQAKASPDSVRMGLVSTTARVVNGMLSEATGASFNVVPYAGGNQALFPDLIRGDVAVAIEAMPSAVGPIQGGQIEGLAVTLPERSTLIPDVPTLKESGIDLTLVGWNAFYAPAGTPEEIITQVNAAAVKALAHPDVAERLKTVASTPMPTTPDELAALIQRDRATWKPMVELYNLKVN